MEPPINPASKCMSLIKIYASWRKLFFKIISHSSYLIQFYAINICPVMIFILYTVYKKHDVDKNWSLNLKEIASIIASVRIILQSTVDCCESNSLIGMEWSDWDRVWGNPENYLRADVKWLINSAVIKIRIICCDYRRYCLHLLMKSNIGWFIKKFLVTFKWNTSACKSISI